MTGDLFGALPAAGAASETLGDGAIVLRGFAAFEAPALLEAVPEVVAAAPFRRMVTPGGYTMSVAMTNCGRVGWVSDRKGYRYAPSDPETGEAWPAIPEAIRRDMLLWVGCIAGALEENDYRMRLAAAGFEAIGIEPTRVYDVEDAREFLTSQSVDVDAIAADVGDKS